MKKEVMKHMKLFKLTTILLVLLLAAMVLVPMVSAAPDKILPDKNFVNVDTATSVANIYVEQFSATIPEFNNWKGATVRKATTYYDLKGTESAYSFDVLVNGQYAGYLMVSATRDNYPVLEFSKEKTPDREITAQNNAKVLAITDAKTRKATLGEGRPVYLGATFYYMQYPVQKAGALKGSQQTSDETILVDLNENKVVDPKKTLRVSTQMKSTEAQSGLALDKDAIQKIQQQKKLDAQTEWNTVDTEIKLNNGKQNIQKLQDEKLSATSSSGTTQKSAFSPQYTGSGKNIANVPNFNNLIGCHPDSAAMILAYYRNVHNFNRFPSDNYALSQELATAMGTFWGFTWNNNVEPGIEKVTKNHNYNFDVQQDSNFNFDKSKIEINNDHPYILAVSVCQNFFGPHIPWPDGYTDDYFYLNHAVTARGYYEITQSNIPGASNTQWIYCNDAQTRYVMIRVGSWFQAHPFWVHPPPSLPAVVPLCKAGDAFDATKYPQNHPQSDPMTFTCNWDGNGRVYLSGSSSSLIGTYADDGFTVDTPKGIQFDAAGHSAQQHPPLEITSGMNTGSNSLTLIVRNYQGLSMSYGSSTGIGTDQTPYIIEVNDPSMIASAQSSALKAVSFVPNSTSLKGNMPARIVSETTNTTVSNG